VVFVIGLVLLLLGFVPHREVVVQRTKHQGSETLWDLPSGDYEEIPAGHYWYLKIDLSKVPHDKVTQITLEIYIEEINGRKFDFYVMDDTEFYYWQHGETYYALYEKKGVTRVDCSIGPDYKEEGYTEAEIYQWFGGALVYIIVYNPSLIHSLQIDGVVYVRWERIEEKTADLIGYVSLVGLVIMVASGIALVVSRARKKETALKPV